VWYEYLVQGLEEIGFTRSKVDECVFYYKSSVLLVYVDDSILMGPDEAELKFLTEEMGKKFNIQEEGDLCDYLGIQIKKEQDGGLTLTQPQLIESILKDMKLEKENVKGRKTPAMKTKVIHKDEDGDDFDNRFHYRSIIGKLNYLEKCTRPDISYAVHQCARFSSCPKESHAEAIKYICRYLAATKNKGVTLKPNGHHFECFVDSSHAGDWRQQSAMDDPSTARSRTGYVINFANCPLIWASKLQTEIALSTTEAEYIALSTASREILPLLSLAKEAKKHKLINKVESPVIRCKIFEDNKGAVEIANVPKMRPRTKHLNIKYHFFRQFIQQGILRVEHIPGEDQMADIFTKALDYASFVKHRQSILGW
jgi:histone deacetylase 1/2